MNHRIFNKGQWRSCNNPIPSDYFKTWEEAAESVGLHGKPCHTFGHPDGFYIRLHTLRPGKVFATNSDIQFLLAFNLGPYPQHYYCTDSENCLDKLEQLTGISRTELLTIEFQLAQQRREAVELEVIDETGKGDQPTRRTPGTKRRTKRQNARTD